ncbi:ATPase [bacterium SCSIO 12741]|nr:ATPase [bacterium SCSIO 12741]
MGIKLISDGGSTKADWVALNEQGETVTSFETQGYNPFYMDSDSIASNFKEQPALSSLGSQISEIYFYGSGCSNDLNNSIVTQGFQQVIPQATIYVEHDLKGAAFATWQGKPGITCILGTGSNSCFFDGQEVSEEIPSLGMIPGDEAGGGYYGKFLVRDFFYRQMPPEIHQDFEATYQLEKDEVLNRLYQQPRPSAFLAQFMPFMANHRKDPYIRKLLLFGMQEFFKYHISCYPEYKQYPVHFIGSIAWYFLDELKEVAEEFESEIGKVIKRPIDGLIDYHRQYSL